MATPATTWLNRFWLDELAKTTRRAKRSRSVFAKRARETEQARRAAGEVMVAAGEGNTARVRELLAAGVNVDEAGEYGKTALIQASSNDHAPVVRLLI